MTLLANLDGMRWEFLLLPLGLLAGLYCLPSIVALLRRHPETGNIVVLNILGGWTVVGWLIAFIWASWSSTDPKKRREDAYNRRQQGDFWSPWSRR